MKDQSDKCLQIEQKQRIRSLSVDRAELRRILEVLQERVYAAADIEERGFKKVEDQADEQFEQAKKDLRDGFRLYVGVSGVNGETLHGSIEEVFDSPNFPDDVRSVFFNSSLRLQQLYGYYPRNRVTVFLDFSRPGIFNLAILPSQETQNESNVEVVGKDATWVNGVFKEFASYVSERPSTLPWLHKHSIYDLILYTLSLPLAFWACSKLSRCIEVSLAQSSSFLRAAIYVYVFAIALNVLRIAFQYTRWIWPLTEFRSEKSSSLKHKAALAFIVATVIGPAIYDTIKWLISLV